MKPFVFKLQSALNLKLREEEIFKEKLFQTQMRYREELTVLSGLKDRLHEVYESIRESSLQKINIHQVKTCTDYIPFLHTRIVKQEQIIEDARKLVEQAREALIKVVRGRKVMEKLRERHYKEYLSECLKQEQKEIDEMAMTGYMHKGSAV